MSSSRKAEGKALIPQFYAGKSVFITGATGFMGKILIERLLSTCPDIGRLYLLLRTKKDVPADNRLLQLKQSPVFDVLRQSNPTLLDKLFPICGDLSQPQLGISAEDLKLLHSISIVFHVAATLKFDEELHIAVNQNVRSVMSIMDICDNLPKIEAFIHVSTAYCNAERELTEERVYPSPIPVDQLLNFVDSAPPNLVAELQNKYISPKPNTYIFTKSVAECVVEQRGNRNYSVSIFRPSIVISSIKDPFPGWIENMNGPCGIVVSAGKGFLHVLRCRQSAKADLLPVDMAIDTLIAVGWETAVDKSSEIKVYNCSTGANPLSWGEFEQYLREGIAQYPLDEVLWYPSAMVVENRLLEKFFQFTLQTVPLYLIEYTKRLLGFKSRVNFIIADQRLKSIANTFNFFTLREFRFETRNFQKLKERLTPEDAKIYNLDVHSIDWEHHVANFVKGTRKYLLKEKDQDVEKAKQHMTRMYILHKATLFLTFVMFIRLLLSNQIIKDIVYGIFRLLLSLFNKGYSRLTE